MEISVRLIIGAILGIIVFVVCFHLISKYVVKGVITAYNITKVARGG